MMMEPAVARGLNTVPDVTGDLRKIIQPVYWKQTFTHRAAR